MSENWKRIQLANALLRTRITRGLREIIRYIFQYPINPHCADVTCVTQSLRKKRHHGPGCEKEWKPPKGDPSIWWRWLNELSAKAPSAEEQDLKKSSKTHAPSVSMKGSLPSLLNCGDDHTAKTWSTSVWVLWEIRLREDGSEYDEWEAKKHCFCLIFNFKYNMYG